MPFADSKICLAAPLRGSRMRVGWFSSVLQREIKYALVIVDSKLYLLKVNLSGDNDNSNSNNNNDNKSAIKIAQSS